MCSVTVINRNLVLTAFFPLDFSLTVAKHHGEAVPWSGRVTQRCGLSTTISLTWLLGYLCASLQSIHLQQVLGRTFSSPEWHSWGFSWHVVNILRGTKKGSWNPLWPMCIWQLWDFIASAVHLIWAKCDETWCVLAASCGHVLTQDTWDLAIVNANITKIPRHCFLKESWKTLWRNDYSAGCENIPPPHVRKLYRNIFRSDYCIKLSSFHKIGVRTLIRE